MKLSSFHPPIWLSLLPAILSQGQSVSTDQAKKGISDQAQTFEPNYVSRMVSPVEGVDEKPRLCASRTTDPIVVAIIDDGYFYTPQLCDIARGACEAWAAATKNVPEGSLHFNYRRATSPAGADIVFIFGTPAQFNGYQGYTSEYGTFALVRVSVCDRRGRPVTPAKIRRVATHEVGHALGIWGHSPDATDIMSLCIDTRTISVADVNTLRLAYHKE